MGSRLFRKEEVAAAMDECGKVNIKVLILKDNYN